MTSKSQGDFHGSAQRSREVAGLVLREIVHEAGVEIPRHAHEHAHLAFVLRGNFTETCERKVLECKPLSVDADQAIAKVKLDFLALWKCGAKSSQAQASLKLKVGVGPGRKLLVP
jgi:hypothetical protein